MRRSPPTRSAPPPPPAGYRPWRIGGSQTLAGARAVWALGSPLLSPLSSRVWHSVPGRGRGGGAAGELWRPPRRAVHDAALRWGGRAARSPAAADRGSRGRGRARPRWPKGGAVGDVAAGEPKPARRWLRVLWPGLSPWERRVPSRKAARRALRRRTGRAHAAAKEAGALSSGTAERGV